MTTIVNMPTLRARLNQLKIQEAKYGIMADPHIPMEIRDLSEVIGQMERIDIHRGNLAHLLAQRGHFGADVPSHIVNSIASEREQIRTLRAYCAKKGFPIDSHEVDADVPAMSTPHPDRVLHYSDDPFEEMRARLQRIEKKIDRLLYHIGDTGD